MSAKTIVTAVVGFLSHHVNDLNNLATALGSIVSSLPIDSQDRERITSVIDDIRQSAENIAKFLSNNTVSDNTVTLKESDIVHALDDFFKTDAGKSALASASAEGNVNA